MTVTSTGRTEGQGGHSTAEGRYVEEHRAEWLTELMEWLRIPSISADPACAADVARSADWLAAALRRAGFPIVEVLPTKGHPAVYAEWPSSDAPTDADAPTVLVYGHHDVQPVDPEGSWTDPPFSPVIVGDELRGRGAIDDKGQVAFHLLGIRAHLDATGRTSPAVHLKVLVEGEEESGSPHFADLLRTNADRFACDVVVVSDTGVFRRGVPSVCTGMRGLLPCQIDVHGPDLDLHSGSFGGAVPNPLAVLADLISGLHDERGRVTLPGFYDRVVPISDAERSAFARLPFDEREWLAGTARSKATAGEDGFATLERIWARPTAEVNGIWGGYSGPGSKTIIPTDGHAKVSFRLVADQRPAEVEAQLRQYLAERTPAGITVDLHFEAGVRPCLTPVDHPANAAVISAVGRAFDQEVLLTREGGSGPEADLAELLAAPVVFLGVGLPDDRFHAPNERAVLDQLYAGAEAAAYLWTELADRPGVRMR